MELRQIAIFQVDHRKMGRGMYLSRRDGDIYEEPIPGAAERECGNWRKHDLAGAKAGASSFVSVLAGYREIMLHYPS